MSKKTILAICGSTRATSANMRLITAIQNLLDDNFEIKLSVPIDSLPHFNPDITDVPKSVIDFRNEIAAADGVLISTPEYAMGVPGTLKNAIDWTVATTSFSNKPTVLITASTSGLKAHEALMNTLKVIEAKMNEDSQLVISFINTKVDKECNITDATTKADVLKVMETLSQLTQHQDEI